MSASQNGLLPSVVARDSVVNASFLPDECETRILSITTR